MKASVPVFPDGRVALRPQGPEKFLPEIEISPSQLPSRGIPYSRGSIVKYRPYTFGEIKKFNQSKVSARETFEMVLEGISCSFDKSALTISDVLYLGLLRKISTLGSSKISVPVICNKCGALQNEILDLGSSSSVLEFEDMSAPELPIIVTLSNNQDYEFSPLTMKDYYLALEKNIEFTDVLALMALQCRNQTYEHTYKMIQEAYPVDRLLLEEVDKLMFHELKPIKIKCKKHLGDRSCGNEIQVALDGGAALLLPFREHEKSTSDRIHFGSKSPRKSS